MITATIKIVESENGCSRIKSNSIVCSHEEGSQKLVELLRNRHLFNSEHYPDIMKLFDNFINSS